MQQKVKTLCGFNAFTKVIKRGKKYERRPIYAFVLLSSAADSSIHVGFAISRNVKRAIDRNRLKRYLRESFRLNKEKLLEKSGKGKTLQVAFLYSEAAGISPRAIQYFTIAQAVKELCYEIRATYVE